MARHDAMRLVNLRALARGARDWSQLPETGMPAEIEAAVSDHPFALDLDVFGRASLFQWLGPASTAGGRLQLARWLIEPASPHEVRERQQAVGRLAVEDDWRLEMAAHGVLAGAARQPDIDRFLAWAEGDDPFGRRAFALRAAVLLIVVHAVGLDRFGCGRRHERGALADPAGGRHRAVVCDRREGAGHPRPGRRRPVCAWPLRRDVRARGARADRRAAAGGAAGAAVVAWRDRPRLHAPPQSHPGLRRAAARRGDPPFPDPGADAVGLPRHLRPRPVAAGDRAARARMARRRSASSMRWRSSRARGGTTRTGQCRRLPRRRRSRPTASAIRCFRTIAASPTTSRSARRGRSLLDHRLEHVGQEHAASLDRAEHRAGAGGRAASAPGA